MAPLTSRKWRHRITGIVGECIRYKDAQSYDDVMLILKLEDGTERIFPFRDLEAVD